MLEQQIEQDLKTALLSGDRQRVLVLRGLKASLLNLKVATGKRDSGLSDHEVIAILAKQSKQRQESADLYQQGGDRKRREAEIAEKAIIDAYLPKQLTETEIRSLVDEAFSKIDTNSSQPMGQIIGIVKQKAGPNADGSMIARLVKEKLQ